MLRRLREERLQVRLPRPAAGDCARDAGEEQEGYSVSALDEQVLDWAQARSDRVQAWTGLDCLQQARVLAVVVAVLWLVHIIIKQLSGLHFDWLAGLCMVGQVHRAF